MPRINLLPWRDELRQQRRMQFYIAIGAAAAVAVLFVIAGNITMNGIVDYQTARNEVLRTEISALNKRIREIVDLEDKKARLLARMAIIEQLQRSRPEIVHVFDDLVKAVPDGIYLTSIKQTGRHLEISGMAESNTRVSALMRNIDRSEWLTDPDLEVVQVRTDNRGEGVKASQFTIHARQVSAVPEEEEE